ncbi:Imm1 family immunity protein [Kitasatospora indigofera]|uniref:Imm1 family immunity protein n=1 Tax=Kitasatospora indigofera TaxID=67307 RepID=UPI00369D91CE
MTFDQEDNYPSSWEEIDRLVSKSIRAASPREIAEGVYSPGHEAWFIVRETQGSRLGGYLRVAADEQSGYGALTWWTRGRTSGIHDSFWISDNPGPPYTGPELVADPYSGECHEPASSLPLPRIRAAIEEFCRSRTGERPTCITWVTGSYNGERDAQSR